MSAVEYPEPPSLASACFELIALTAEAEDPMKAVSAAEAIEERGLLGDRYERGAGTFSNPKGGDYDLTLVEAEALEELSEKGVDLAPIEARRNLVVSHRLSLVGNRRLNHALLMIAINQDRYKGEGGVYYRK